MIDQQKRCQRKRYFDEHADNSEKQDHCYPHQKQIEHHTVQQKSHDYHSFPLKRLSLLKIM